MYVKRNNAHAGGQVDDGGEAGDRKREGSETRGAESKK